jgi:hypothetical protein
LHVVLYGCKTQSLTPWEKQRLLVVSEEGAEEDVWVQDKATEKWKKLHSEELNNL